MAATIATAAAAAALAGPGAAQAQEQCLFQGVQASASTATKVERSILCLTNLHRARSGLGALKRDTRLGTAARAHSADMVARDYFDHVSPEGTTPSDRARAAGYPGGAGENLAALGGSATAFTMFDGWRKSPGHNQNMLNPPYETIGIGVAPGFPGQPGAGATGTQMFGFPAANTGDTGLDLYASSAKCAKAKMRKLKAKGKQKRKAASREVRKRCKSL
jgi:uncharacterized protein YkwD